jgi:alkylated DNA repair dioxygenase AlkB
MNPDQIKPLQVLTAFEDDTLVIIPLKNKPSEKIFLTKSQSAWITIEWLSDEMLLYSKKYYQQIFDLHPQERGKVVLWNKEITSSRWHRSYLNTPCRKPVHENKSYMYSGLTEYKDYSLPFTFLAFLDFINEKEIIDKYNQVIANWYANGYDYIAAHSDCQMDMKANASIAILSLSENELQARELIFSFKKLNGIENDSFYKNVKIALHHGSIIRMHGDTQLKFRHRIPADPLIKSSRVSLTFRKTLI